jgi:transposase
MVNLVDYLMVNAGPLAEVSEAKWTETLRTHRLDALRSIRHLIERNLERLKPEEQAVLEAASVAGTEFSSAAVAAALECPQNEVEACCTRLARHEQFVSEQGPITWPDGTVAASFRFHHALYQEVLDLTRFRRRCWGKGRRSPPMPRTHPPYAAEYRHRIVELARGGRHLSELAREFEPTVETIRQWVKQAELDEGLRSDGLTTGERDELNRLRRENRVLREEREILAKAAAWFAQETGATPSRRSHS